MSRKPVTTYILRHRYYVIVMLLRNYFLVAGEMAFADGLPKKFLQSQGSFSVDIIRTKVADGDVYVPYKIVSSNAGNFKTKIWLSHWLSWS